MALSNMMTFSNLKLNAAGLTPDHSLVLPEREALQDELSILQSLNELYSHKLNETTFKVFSANAVYTMPNGDVIVGPKAIEKKFVESTGRNCVQQRLLSTPESLPARTMCIDQVISTFSSSSTNSTSDSRNDTLSNVRNLIVIKRRQADGLITNVTEEEGHRRATLPLTARVAASNNNFYSPTDNMLSPCTSKLNLAKKKHHLKGKPTTLFPSKLTNSSKINSSATAVGSDDMEF